jgi:hypothetical protein
MSDNRSIHEWKLLQDQFDALVRDRPDNAEDILDAEFCSRLGRLIFQATRHKSRRNRGAHFKALVALDDEAIGSEAP